MIQFMIACAIALIVGPIILMVVLLPLMVTIAFHPVVLLWMVGVGVMVCVLWGLLAWIASVDSL